MHHGHADMTTGPNDVPFRMEKLEWLGYPMVKNFEDIFIRFGATHELDGQTDGRTPHNGDMHSIARQKKQNDGLHWVCW